MRLRTRIIVAVVVGLVAVWDAMEFAWPAAGGPLYVHVAGNQAMAKGLWIAGCGAFLTAVAVMMWRTGVRKVDTSDRKVRLSRGAAIVLRVFIAVSVLGSIWSVIGGRYVRSYVRAFVIDADPRLIETKLWEAEKADLPFRIWMRPGPDSLLVVRKEHAERVRKELEGEGFALREVDK